MTTAAELTDVTYSADGPLAWITFNRPRYKNAQSWKLLDEVDVAMDEADRDPGVQVILWRGAGGNFSSGHDLGTPEQMADREARGIGEAGVEFYDNFKHYNLDLLLKWRNARKPTIAMVEGYCIFAGWMMAACVDIVFAAKDALFLAGFVEYMSIPWDIGVKRAKELCFESRFISADEAAQYGFVNRVLDPADLERETYAYAMRVAENNPMNVRMAKLQMNKAQDVQGYTSALEDSLGDYLTMSSFGGQGRVEGARRLATVDLAVRGRKGDRFGLTPQK